MNLEDTLKRAAYKVWDELEPIPKSDTYKVFEVREEALTTMAIKEMFRSNCPKIDRIEMISPDQENISGYDFEMAIGSKTKGKYIRFFIQAKRLYGKNVDASYNALDFGQTDKLVDYAKGKSSLGMYAFYNYLTNNDLTLEDYYNSATGFDRKSMGITIASAYSVKRLRRKDFEQYHFNNGNRANLRIYSLRRFSHLFYFHQQSLSHLAVPFHELAYLTIDLAETINKLYREIKDKSKLHLLLFLGLEDLFGGEESLIPVMKTSPENLVSDFKTRLDTEDKSIYNPEALIIIDTD